MKILENKMFKTNYLLGAALSISLFSAPSFATTQASDQLDPALAEKGRQILMETKKRDEGWVDFTADMLMVLRNDQGQESVREVKMKSLEQLTDGDKSLTIFNKPKDVKGTAFLSYSHVVGADDQWLFLPSIKRVKRISSSNKSGPFMGSEFSFEDLSSFEIDKYRYQYLADEKVGDLESFKVEQYPVDENSGYTRRIVWVDKDEYRIIKIDFYDRKNALLKTLSYNNFELYLGQYWRALESEMFNHQTGKSTSLVWNNYQFKTGLKESDFSRSSLKRAK